MFVSNAAWQEFLKSILGFTSNQLNALLFFAGVFGLCWCGGLQVCLDSMELEDNFHFGD
jgi:hypothetical protein